VTSSDDFEDEDIRKEDLRIREVTVWRVQLDDGSIIEECDSKEQAESYVQNWEDE